MATLEELLQQIQDHTDYAAALQQSAQPAAVGGGSPTFEQLLNSTPNQSPQLSHDDVMSALLSHPATKQTAQAVVDNNHLPQTPDEQKAYDFIGQILSGSTPPPMRLPPVNDLFGPPPMDDPSASATLPDQSIGAIGQPQSQAAQSPVFLSQVGGGLSSALQSLMQPGNVNGVPTPSAFNTLAGLGIGLATGGGIQGASGINTLQQIQAIGNAGTAPQLQMNQYQLDNASPAGQLRKTQQQFYTSRMASDVNRYIKMIGDDQNGNIPDGERDRIWSQIQQKYAPLGLDPGPSPSQIQQWNSQAASPEFRNAALAQTFNMSYGPEAGQMVNSILQSGGTPKDVAQYQLQLEKLKTENKKIEYQAKEKDFLETQKRIEEFRKRDLEMYKEAGVTGGQLTSAMGSKLVTSTPSYLGGQAKINAFYDAQHQALREGRTVNASQMGFNIPSDLSKKTFDKFSSGLGGNGPMSPAVHGDSLAFPATTTPAQLSNLPPEQKARALTFGSEAEARSTLKIPAGQSVLVRIRGQLGLLKAPAAL